MGTVTEWFSYHADGVSALVLVPHTAVLARLLFTHC